MTLFVFNIGNTNTQYAIYSDGKIKDIKYCPTTELNKSLIPDDMPVAVATVVPETKSIFSESNVFYMTPDIKTGLDLSLIDTSTLGMDRLANMVALAKFVKLPAIAVDCGTAITVDALDEKCVFRGGAIAPGRQLIRKALNIYTAQLPFVSDINEKPSALGKNTTEAIHSGVDRGIIGLVKEIISGIQLEMGAKVCQLIAVGGDADFFCRNILELHYGGEDFTLRGIATAWELSQKCV